MTLDGFLTFLTLVLAAYTLATHVDKLRAKLVIVLQIPLALVSLFIVVYLEFFEVFGQPCPAVLGSLCTWIVFKESSPLSPSGVAFFVVLFWIIFAIVIHLSIPRLFSSFLLVRIARIVDRLSLEKRYSELLEFIEPYLPVIGKASHRKLFLQRHHDNLGAMQGDIAALRYTVLDQESQSAATHRSGLFKVGRRWLGKLAFIVPSQYSAQDSAENIARVFFQSEELRVYIATNRPYFAIPLIYQDIFGSRQFSEKYLSLLIADTGSVLYQEIQYNQNISYQHGYEFPVSNRLLYFLFSNANIALQLEVWQPVGKHILQLLNPNKSSDFVDYLQGTAVEFDYECWENGVFVGVVFFDLMVKAAAYQGVTWHMWLYYMTSVIDALEGSYDSSDPSVDTTDEFPTRSARLVYVVLSTLCSWIHLVSELPDDSHHRNLPKQNNGVILDWNTWSLPNDNIPLSSAVALGTCLATILESERFEYRFIVEMFEVVLREVSRLNESGDEGYMRSFLIHSIIHGGQKHLDIDYGNRLRGLLNDADRFILYEIKDFKTSLDQIHPTSMPNS